MVKLVKPEPVSTSRNLSAEQIATDLQVTTREVTKLLATGVIPGGFRVGRLWRVEEADFLAFKKAQKEKCARDAKRVISTVQETDA